MVGDEGYKKKPILLSQYLSKGGEGEKEEKRKEEVSKYPNNPQHLHIQFPLNIVVLAQSLRNKLEFITFVYIF